MGASCGPLKPVSKIRVPGRPTPLDGLNWVLTSYGLPKVWVKEGLTTVYVIGPGSALGDWPSAMRYENINCTSRYVVSVERTHLRCQVGIV